MVKALLPIGDIAGSISLSDGQIVRLMRESGNDANGATQTACDPYDAVQHALAHPLDFPPLAASIVPGDCVAIAVDEEVPCVGEVVRGAVESLRQAGVEPEAISVVTADTATGDLCRAAFADHTAAAPQFVVHDPDDKDKLCMVGITKKGRQPLLINRTIFDADVVLPIGCARLGGRGAFECLFPRFSDTQSIDRYRTPTAHIADEGASERHRATDEAGWLVGAPLVVEVVPGAGESVAHVIAGEPQAVAEQTEALCRETWLLHSPQQVSLVIATITGGPLAQSWENVGRALTTADQLLVEGGAVAICSNLDQPPGESLGRLIRSSDLEKTERKLLHDHAEDSWPAWQLARALQRGPVYFFSQLDADTIEDMGLAPIAGVDELVRLASRHDSCAIVEDSQNAVVTVDAQ